MDVNWFPNDKKELLELLDMFVIERTKKANGIIVPHAGYQFSGSVAGGAYNFLRERDRVVIFGPSHSERFNGIRAIGSIETPLGKVDILDNDFQKIKYEHSVVNQVPFLQKLNINLEVLPLVVGHITKDEAKAIAKDFKDFDGAFVFSTDLSHFLEYQEAVDTDTRSIGLIEDLNVLEVDACGKYPLMIMQELCKIKGWKPELIDYENSGDVTGDKKSVVGYASFYF